MQCEITVSFFMHCIVSPQTQNEMIDVIGRQIILQSILDELNDAPLYSILADEVTSHNMEHLSHVPDL